MFNAATRVSLIISLWISLGTVGVLAQTNNSSGDALAGDAMLQAFFEREVETMSGKLLEGISDLDGWKRRRKVLRSELEEMLGIDLARPRSELRAVVTGTLDRPDLGIVVEKIHFQSLPGLYVTANLYRPREFSGKLPAVLYLCGHARVKIDGVAYGSKVAYQHHPTWLAQHGFVCLIVDTLQLGEIEGFHHGTYYGSHWWWVSRGYTPAGVEAWNSIRALDYLVGRPEVDGSKLGVTGRSGGGIGSWWIGALDDRLTAMVPVAGITDLQNHIVDGCIEGHCDCMYPVNLYRWNFSALAALSAPRALLFSNSDKDRIFPLDGVQRIYWPLREVYKLYGAEAKLGLLITEGPHKDTQQLRVPAFLWMQRWLQGDTEKPVDRVARKYFEPKDLKVFKELPADQINTKISESFVPRAKISEVPANLEAFKARQRAYLTDLEARTFRGVKFGDLVVTPGAESRSVEKEGLRLSFCHITSEGFRLPVRILSKAGSKRPRNLWLDVQGEEDWARGTERLGGLFPEEFPSVEAGEASRKWAAAIKRKILEEDGALAQFAPRGIGPTRWSGNVKKHNQIRRRFLLLGRTLTQARIYDTRAAIHWLSTYIAAASTRVVLQGRGEFAGIAVYSAIFEPRVEQLELHSLPASHRDGVTLMNVLKIFDIPQAVSLLFPRRVVLHDVNPEDFASTRRAAALFAKDGEESPLQFRPR